MKIKPIDRIKQFIEYKKMTISGFEKHIEVSNNSLGAAIRRRTAVKDETLNTILYCFPNVRAEWLLTGEGEMLKKNEVIEIDSSKMSVMNVPLVHVYAYAGYLDGFGDNHYIDELPKVPWVSEREGKGNYLCFEVKGDSMDDGSHESYLAGDILLCREVSREYWKSRLHIKKWDFVIVHKEEGVLLKRIIKHDVDNCIITMHSLNDYYDDKELHLKDVSKLFNVVDFKRSKKRR